MHHIVCYDCGCEWEDENSLYYYSIIDESLECPNCGSDNLDDDDSEH